MHQIDYYTSRRGEQPVDEWREGLDKKSRSISDATIDSLREYGLIILNTKMMKSIKGEDRDLFELICGKYRIVVFNDKLYDKFILLHGFKKGKQRETKQIEIARRRLDDYLLIR